MSDTTREIIVGDEAHFAASRAPTTPPPRLACGGCGSVDTECIHAHGGGSLIGWWSEVEFRCRACGAYTAEIVESGS